LCCLSFFDIQIRKTLCYLQGGCSFPCSQSKNVIWKK
jgi:hypothetical protein